MSEVEVKEQRQPREKKEKKEKQPHQAHNKRMQMAAEGADGKPKDGSWAYSVDKSAMRKVDNPRFTNYYRDLNPLTSPEEWEAFVEVMRTPLMTTVWINDTDPMAPIVRDHFISLGEDVAEPIPWYPLAKMGWRIKVDKMQFRRDKTFAPLRRFMITQTASGTISRQEEVSMIPPFLLDIKPTDRCFDMCASPGSKTAQMLVGLCRHKQRPVGAAATDFPFDYTSEGCVVANELDSKRANMLVYQVKRLRTLFPFAMFTNHDARYFPSPRIGNDADPENGEMEFDKILCDVVCSGDGTLRKAPHMFGRWKSHLGTSLQQLQIEIALRGCHLLKVGGRIVYSTCSMNPIENEAVVQQLVKRTNGAMKVIDVTKDLLPNLKYDKGWTTWKVVDQKETLLSEPSRTTHTACFPMNPPPYGLDLTKCLRLLPKHCGGGGFFVCVLEKVSPFKFTSAELKAEEDMLKEQEVQRRKEARLRAAGKKEERTEEQIEQLAKELEADEKAEVISRAPKFFNSPDTLTSCLKDYYKIEPSAAATVAGGPTTGFPIDHLMVRSDGGIDEVKTQQSYFVSNTVRKIVLRQDPKCTIVSTGVRAFVWERRGNSWRVATEFSNILAPKLIQSGSGTYMDLPFSVATTMLNNGKMKDILVREIPDEAFRTKVEALGYGSLVFNIAGNHGNVICAGFRAKSRILIFVDNEDVLGLKNRLGIEIEEAELTNAEAEKTEPVKEEADVDLDLE